MVNVTVEQAEQLAIKKLASFGFSQEDALHLARTMIEAELRNDPGHGLAYVKKMQEVVEDGAIDPKKVLSPVEEYESSIVLDCEKAAGPAAAIKGIDLAIEKAKKTGVGVASLRKSHHLFSMAYYARYAALKNMIVFITTSSQGAITPQGGSKKIFGTNPLGFGCPTNNTPLVIDMSSTTVARGKVKEAQKNGEKIPLTWAYDPEGNPTDDPDIALKGSLQPMGGYKGFLLAFIIDILSSVLSGSAYAQHIYGTSMHANKEDREIQYKGDFIFVLDPEKYLPLADFKAKVSDVCSAIESDSGYVPGKNAESNRSQGIELSEATIEYLNV